MLPLLPFAAGLLAGAVTIKLWRNDKTRTNIDSAKKKLREATVSGLNALEHSSASVRQRLSTPTAETSAQPVEKPVASAPKKRIRKPAVSKTA